MSIPIQMEKETLLLLWENIQQHIRERYIVQGFNFHLKRRIQIKQIIKEVVSAEVRGQKETFYVELDLHDFANRRCSCPFKGKCRHVAALFFYLYASCGRPEMLMQEFYKEVAKKQKDEKEAKRKARRRTVQDQKQVEEWHEQFAAKVIEARILDETDPQLLWEKIKAVLDRPEGYPDDSNIVPLFRFHMTVFVLNKVQQLVMNADRSLEQSRSFQQSVREMIEQSRASLQPEGWQSEVKYVRQTLEHLTENILNSRKMEAHWLQLYQTFIAFSASTAKRLERERLRLEGVFQTSKLTGAQKNALRLMLAHVEMIGGNDEKALKWITSGGQPAHSFIIRILRDLHTRKDWDRLAVWLKAVHVEYDHLNREQLTELAFFWKEVAERFGKEEEFERWLKNGLPLSDHLYASFLFERKRYRAWMELQMIRGLGLADLQESERQQIETTSPQKLLPMYHQEIERLILQKKRSTYTEAVKRLVELKKIYARLGQAARFQQYVEHISEKYRPYQALREEMMKGNIRS